MILLLAYPLVLYSLWLLSCGVGSWVRTFTIVYNCRNTTSRAQLREHHSERPTREFAFVVLGSSLIVLVYMCDWCLKNPQLLSAINGCWWWV